ncbi:hypothetical protein DFH05DRAFT_1457450 [Lentinula detonsa]|uniref:Uncharacterized protein n=1 Tax=Lentinula detonsa TaxID=2804962 RepID=A0A9W8P9K7_9AGAR|nr:hypothetical protein DFH05DRAFT_1457450 [Lentinula detonsa]
MQILSFLIPTGLGMTMKHRGDTPQTPLELPEEAAFALKNTESIIKRGVRIIGEENVGVTHVPTISKREPRSSVIVKVFDKKAGIRICFGHFYASSSKFTIDELEAKLMWITGG